MTQEYQMWNPLDEESLEEEPILDFVERDELVFEDIPLSLPSPKKSCKIFNYNVIRDTVHEKDNLLRIIDIYLDAITDENFRDFVSFWSGIYIPFPKGFSRILGFKLFERLPLQTKLKAATAILEHWSSGFASGVPNVPSHSANGLLKIQQLGFILNQDSKIVGFLRFVEDEYHLDGIISMGLCAKGFERLRAAHSLIKFWEEFFAQYLFQKGIRFIYSHAWSTRNASVMTQITKREKKAGSSCGFFPSGVVARTRFNGKGVAVHRYEFDLFRKFKEKKS